MSFTATRDGLHQATQKAQEAYALARRTEEQLRGLVERMGLLEMEIARLSAPKPKATR